MITMIRTIARWMIGLLFCGAVALFVLISSLPLWVNPNDYKAQIADFLREQSGREVVITGDIKLQISPLLHASCVVGSVRLATLASNAIFPDNTILECEKTTIEISLLPLVFFQRLHLSRIECAGLTLNLVRNADGRGNWQEFPAAPLAEPSTREPLPRSEGASAPAENSSGSSAAPMVTDAPSVASFVRHWCRSPFFFSVCRWLQPKPEGLDIGKLSFSDMQARYENRGNGRVVLIKKGQMTVGRLREKIPVPYEVSFNLALDNSKTPESPALIHSGEITMQGNATALFQEQRLVLEDLQAEGLIKGKSLAKKSLNISLASNSEISFPQIDGENATAGAVTIKDFTLTHGDIVVQGSGTLDNFSSPRYSFSLNIPECSPQATLQRLKITRKLAANAEAFTRMQAKLLLTGDMGLTEVSGLTVLVDESTWTGSIRRRSVAEDERPQWEADLKVDRLDSDRYAFRPSPSSVANNISAPPLPSWQPFLLWPGNFSLPIDSLKTASFKLNLAIDSLQVRGAHLAQAQATVTGQGGVIQLAPLTASLYGGALQGEDRLDLSGDTAKLQIRRDLTALQLAPFFRDMTGKEGMTGTANLHADLTSRGVSQRKILNQMNGALRVEVVNGEIGDWQLLPVIRAEIAGQEPEVPVATETQSVTSQEAAQEEDGDHEAGGGKISGVGSEEGAGERVSFTRLAVGGRIRGGVFHSDDLSFASTILSIAGTADLDLASQQVDSSLAVSFSPDCDPDGRNGIAALCNQAVFYKMVGSLAHLSQTASLRPAATSEILPPVASLPESGQMEEQAENPAASEEEAAEDVTEEARGAEGD